MNVCFDVDGCILTSDRKPIRANIEILKVISLRHKVYVWSGNGYEYAYHWVKELKLEKRVCGVLNKYGSFRPDIAFDDHEIDLGRLNICVS